MLRRRGKTKGGATEKGAGLLSKAQSILRGGKQGGKAADGTVAKGVRSLTEKVRATDKSGGGRAKGAAGRRAGTKKAAGKKRK